MTYPGTDAHFEQYTRLPDLHDPVVLGPGSDSIQATSQVYGALAAMFDKAVADLNAVLSASRHAQQGQAADAARRHVLAVVAVGEAGAERARLATYALQEQAAYFARARTDMQAAAEKVAGGPPVPAGGTKGPSQVAVDAAHEAGLAVAISGAKLYETNSNHNLNFVFQGFDPPQIAAPQVAAGPAQPAADRAPGGGGRPGTTPVTSAAVTHATAPPGPAGPGGPTLPPGAVPPASGVPSGPVPPGPAPAGPVRPLAVPAARPSPPPVPPSAPTPPASRAVPDLPAVPRSDGSPPGSSRPGGVRPGAFPIGTDPPPERPGWAPGRPWPRRPEVDLPGDPSGRRSGGPAEESTRSGTGQPRPVSGRPTLPGVAEPGPARTAANGHQPYLPMGGGGGREQDAEHRRPSWLTEPDPEALWMSGLPPHGPAVIEPLED